jgi:hypothetical protein
LESRIWQASLHRLLWRATGDPVDERHEHGAEVEAEGAWRSAGLHAGEGLLVEELDEPHGGEHLGQPEH